MSISYRQIQAFVCVAQSNTFADAADQLHITQPALSTAIKKLEIELGGDLFQRTTRTIDLTPEGKFFLTQAKGLLGHWDTVVQDTKRRFSSHEGTLTVSSMPVFAEAHLPQLLQQFHQAFPSIAIRVRDVVMEDAIDSVLAGQSELGFVFEPVKMSGLVFHPLFEAGFIVAMLPEHQLANVDSASWQDILPFPNVLMHKGTSVRAWIDAVVPSHNSLKIVAETSQLSTVTQLVSRGLGVGIVPELCRTQLKQKGLICVPLEETGLRKSVGVIYSKRRALSVPAQSLLKRCVNQKWSEDTTISS